MQESVCIMCFRADSGWLTSTPLAAAVGVVHVYYAVRRGFFLQICGKCVLTPSRAGRWPGGRITPTGGGLTPHERT